MGYAGSSGGDHGPRRDRLCRRGPDHTDLKELIKLDFQGAPYGYTPMGNDNEDMEGFLFWKMRYWQQFLQRQPYHIG